MTFVREGTTPPLHKQCNAGRHGFVYERANALL